MAAARLRQRDQMEHATLIGYQAVKAYVLTVSKKKMPDFDALIGPRQPGERKRQSVDEQRVLLSLFAAKHGLTMRKERTH